MMNRSTIHQLGDLIPFRLLNRTYVLFLGIINLLPYKIFHQLPKQQPTVPMPRPLLPPQGVNVPTPLIYSAALSAPVIRTWMQLRGLAWERFQTPQFQMLDFARFVSKSPSTIYGHMAILRSLGILRWRSCRNGMLTVSFPVQEMEALQIFQIPGILESASLKDLMVTNHDHLSIKRESPFLESKKLENRDSPETGAPTQPENNQTQLDDSPAELDDNPAKPDINQAQLDYSPIGIYRSLMKVKPNQVQRAAILEQVKDFNLWYACLEHWLAHKWSKVNIPGILELYQRGGPEHCRYCRDGEHKSQIEIIEELREEAAHGKP